MWKPWKNNNVYKKPRKPRNVNKQVSMMWDFMYNDLPHILGKQDSRIAWQDRKINFVLILLAILAACFGKMALS